MSEVERRHDVTELLKLMQRQAEALETVNTQTTQQSVMIASLTDEIRLERSERREERADARKEVGALHEKINAHALGCKYPVRLGERMDGQDKIIADIRAKQNTHWGIIGAWGAIIGFVVMAVTKFAASFLGGVLAKGQ